MTSGDTILHATAVALDGKAVLIRGAAGSGKSGLALQLIALGATLVADDRTRLWREGARLLADAPDTIRGRIEARGIGILNAPATGPQPVVLVVDMDRTETDRLPPARQTEILGISLPVLQNVAREYHSSAIHLYLRHGRHA